MCLRSLSLHRAISRWIYTRRPLTGTLGVRISRNVSRHGGHTSSSSLDIHFIPPSVPVTHPQRTRSISSIHHNRSGGYKGEEVRHPIALQLRSFLICVCSREGEDSPTMTEEGMSICRTPGLQVQKTSEFPWFGGLCPGFSLGVGFVYLPTPNPSDTPSQPRPRGEVGERKY